MMRPAYCPVCAVAHHVCPGQQAGSPTPVDQLTREVSVADQGPLKVYEVTTPGGTRTRLKLTEDDAKAMGVLTEQKAEKKARKPANKSRAAKTAAADTADDE